MSAHREPFTAEDEALLLLRDALARKTAYIDSADALLRQAWTVVVKSGDELLADAISDLLDRRP